MTLDYIQLITNAAVQSKIYTSRATSLIVYSLSSSFYARLLVIPCSSAGAYVSARRGSLARLVGIGMSFSCPCKTIAFYFLSPIRIGMSMRAPTRSSTELTIK